MKQKKQPKPTPPTDWLPATRKNGEGVRQTLMAGQIVETGVTGLTGSVTKYKAV